MTDLARKRKRDREYMRARRADNPQLAEKERQWQNQARKNDVVKYLFRAARGRSIKFGRDFDLTVEWARERWTGRCELTGIEFDWSRGTIHALSPSLDRIDSSQGYTQNNCRFILQSLNAFKGCESDEMMMTIARALVGGASHD